MSVLPAAVGAASCAGALAGTGAVRRLRLRPPPAVARLTHVGAGLGCVGAWRLAGRSTVQLLAAAAAGALFLRVLRARARQRRRLVGEADVVALCFGVAAELRAGRVPGDALATVGAQLGPLSDGVAAAARAVRRGARVDDELLVLVAESGSPRLRTVAAVWAASVSTGAGAADVLDRVGQAFAADDGATAELAALAAGPRATALVLCALPAFALGLGAAIGADPTALLLHSPFGWLLSVVAAVLDGCGLLWVRAITRGALAG